MQIARHTYRLLSIALLILLGSMYMPSIDAGQVPVYKQDKGNTVSARDYVIAGKAIQNGLHTVQNGIERNYSGQQQDEVHHAFADIPANLFAYPATYFTPTTISGAAQGIHLLHKILLLFPAHYFW